MSVTALHAGVERLGLVVSPDGDPREAEGMLNPACTRTRDGELILYPRAVAKGNISRIARIRNMQRDGYALEPRASYEVRPHPGYGCEDPRVTFVGALDQYVMAYTAFGPEGPRIALALSDDAITWKRLGVVEFNGPGMSSGEDKDAAFFPEPVRSPAGVMSFAMYHRPMLHLSAVDGRAAIPMIERMPFADRESIRIAYFPVEPALRDRKALLAVRESVLVLSPDKQWGSIKIGAGTPPVRTERGWMSVFHGVDLLDNNGSRPKFRYSAGLVIHDLLEPHRVLYRSPQPILVPEAQHELVGVVDNVVFPSGIDERRDLGPGVYDVYYGMADYSIGAARLRVE